MPQSLADRCLLEMWEAALHQVPVLLFPVAGGGFDLEDTRRLLSNLEGEMEGRNPGCLTEVMGHTHQPE